jgi:SpoVK/Ycf46/Vps4 family AAA+-type ATPase
MHEHCPAQTQRPILSAKDFFKVGIAFALTSGWEAMMAPQNQNQALGKFEAHFSAHIRARYALLYLNTSEEMRAERSIERLCEQRSASLFSWTRTQGVSNGSKKLAELADPMAVLRWYEALGEKSVLLLKDFHPYLKEPSVVRKLRDLAQLFKQQPKNIVLLSSNLTIPAELSKEVAVLDFPLPERLEIRELVVKASQALSADLSGEPLIEEIVEASCGLTYEEIENVLAKSIVSKNRLDKSLVLDEKKQIVKKSGLVDFIDTAETESEVGGMESLREWLKLRRRGFSNSAREAGLPLPKGILLVGVPGCGKSLTAMTVGREWKLPLLRLDLGRIFSGLVGSSENNVRGALAICEAVAPCVLWIDEIEKGLSGVKSSGSSDGGTTSRVFGTLLTWMQEKKSPVFVVATANDISQLPPELLRKGRFDEIFFVDLPTARERQEILKIHLARSKANLATSDLTALAGRMEGFSGSEIEQALVAARYLAFGSDQVFDAGHLQRAIEETVPLSQTMGDRIEGLRNWAKHRARPATNSVVEARSAFGFSSRTESLERSQAEEIAR